MATDLENLVARLSNDIRSFSEAMKRAAKVADRQARDIELKWRTAAGNK